MFQEIVVSRDRHALNTMTHLSVSDWDRRRVVITGVGVISPIGIGKDIFWESLVQGRSGIRRVNTFDVRSYPTQVAGEIIDFDPSDFISHKDARRMDRSNQMIVAAAKMAVEDASLDLNHQQTRMSGVFTGTAIGGQGWAFREYEVFREKGLNRINPFTAISTFPNASSALISGSLGFQGPSVTISSGCASSSLALGYAVDNLRLGRVDVALVGGTEAPLQPGIFAAYCAARVMTRELVMPKRVPKPFDMHRDGIVLSEGAGVVVCETMEHAIRRGARIYAEVRGWSHTSDAQSMMMLNPDGQQAQLVMQQAIAEAGLTAEDIDVVFAHAAGTKNDDKTEVHVLHSVFRDNVSDVAVTAVKSLFGHTQGACGVIETAAAVLSVAKGIIPPTVNCDSLDPECAANIVRGKPVVKPVRNLLMNTFGFGGKNVSVIFGSLEKRRYEVDTALEQRFS